MLHLTDPSQLMEPTQEEYAKLLDHMKLERLRADLFELDDVITVVALSGAATVRDAARLIETYRNMDAAFDVLSRELGTLN